MGREIQRVPLNFDWPIGETWLAYATTVKFPECPTCRVDDHQCSTCLHRYTGSDGYSQTARDIKAGLRSGAIPWPDDMDKWDQYRALEAIAADRGLSKEDLLCPRCQGNGDLATPELREWAESPPKTPIPTGEGWQLWETVGDSPMSPVFATDTELVDWMTSNPWMLGHDRLVPSDWETAQRFVTAGWAPSMVTVNEGGHIRVIDGVTAVTTT